MTRRPSLTAAEWHALASAIVAREGELDDRAALDTEPVGPERAALARAERKVREHLVARRSWGGGR